VILKAPSGRVQAESIREDDDHDDFDRIPGYGNSYRGFPAKNLVKLNRDGTVDFDFLRIFMGTNNSVRAIAISQEGIYIGGDFVKIGGFRANHVAKIDSSGKLDLKFSPQSSTNGTDKSVYALVATGEGVFIGGEFNSYHGIQARSLIKVSPNGVLDSHFASGCVGTDGSVHALALANSSTYLYVGGNFSNLRGVRVSALAEIDITTGQVNSHFSPVGCAEDVLALAVDPNGRGVYVGGRSRFSGGPNGGRLARVATTGSMDQSFSPQIDGAVLALAVDSTGDRVYAGGTFRTINGRTANGIAMMSFNGTVSSQFSPSSGLVGVGHGNSNRSYPEVDAVAVEEGDVLIGGSFSRYRDKIAFDYAELDLDGDQ
jgi:hypothetical protein